MLRKRLRLSAGTALSLVGSSPWQAFTASLARNHVILQMTNRNSGIPSSGCVGLIDCGPNRISDRVLPLVFGIRSGLELSNQCDTRATTRSISPQPFRLVQIHTSFTHVTAARWRDLWTRYCPLLSGSTCMQSGCRSFGSRASV